MDVAEAVRKRMSVRAFKPDPVPGDVVRAMLETAAQAPSGGNLQPWRVYALAGDPLADFKALIAKVNREDLWREAAKELGVPATQIPTSTSRIRRAVSAARSASRVHAGE